MNRAETERWIAKLPRCPNALRGRDIVVLSHQRWGAHFTPIHGTTLRLAQQNRVLFMEPPDSAASLRHHPAARAALARTFDRVERFGAQLAVYHVPPLFLPFQPYSRMIRRSIEWTYLRMVRDGLRQMDLRDPLLWIYQFNTIAIVEALAPRLTVYECMEDAAGFARRRRVRDYVRAMDARLCERADVVFVPNAQMYAARQAVCRRIHLTPWPVDFEHYNQALDPALSIPPEIDGLRRPIIGFYGNLDACRFDVELVLTLARRHPEWSIVLIGPLWAGFEPGPLGDLPNIRLLGPKPVEQLPACLKGFDVGIIPYKLNDFTRSITPLKLMEYLATGKPVVTTALPAALQHADVLRIASDVDAFEHQIAAALAAPDENQAARLRVARAHNWEACMRQKADLLTPLLEQDMPRVPAMAAEGA